MPANLLPLILVVTLVAVVLIVQSVGNLVLSAGDRQRRVNRRLTLLQQGMAPKDVYETLVRRPTAPNIGGERMADLNERALDYIRQAGLGVTPLRLFLFWTGSTGALWVVGLVFLQNSQGGDILLNGAVSLFGAASLSCLAIWSWVSIQRGNRLKKLEQQLPLALDIVNRAIRAGHPVVSAVQLAANELGDPIGSEFGLIVDETTYGMEFKDALANFARRTGSSDAHFFAVSVGIQSQTGGNLGEILEGLAAVIRGRASLDLKVKALASEGRTSAYILSALPLLLVGFFALIEPKFYTDKFSDPVFWPVVAFIVALYFAGWLMIQRIVNFKY
ncbi:MAG TPA: type II secretion system F family protein [Caulobacteraceae bacterium]|nr:type II secretion system F family protein [Caulobacteraceae bacterium]